MEETEEAVKKVLSEDGASDGFKMSDCLDAVSLEAGEGGCTGSISDGGAEPEATGSGNTEDYGEWDGDLDCSSSSSISMELITPRHWTESVLALLGNSSCSGNTEGNSGGDQPDCDSDCSSSSSISMELITPRPSHNWTDSLLSLLEDPLFMNKMIDILTNKSELISEILHQKFVPLILAVLYRDTEGILQCLEAGIDVNIGCAVLNKICTPLWVAVTIGREDVVQLLLEKGADVNIPFRDGVDSASILSACLNFKYNKTVMKLLLSHNADANGFMTFTLYNVAARVTVLGLAVIDNVIPAVKLLLDHGADVNGESERITNDDETAQGGSEDDNITIESGTKPEERFENMSLTPLMMADNTMIATLLLEHGAKVNYQGSHGGLTALMTAINQEECDVVSCLFEHGAEVDLQDCNGNTALMYTVFTNSQDVVELLLKHNANVDLCNHDGKDALQIAKAMGFTDIERLLAERAKIDHASTQTVIATSEPFSSAGIVMAMQNFHTAMQQQMSEMQQLMTTAFQGFSQRIDTVESKLDDIHREKQETSTTTQEYSEKPKLPEALRLLQSCACDWQNIGTLLEIDAGQLKAIRMKENNDPFNCLREMLTEWLHRMTPPPTWQALAEAVRPYNQAKAHEIENIN